MYKMNIDELKSFLGDVVDKSTYDQDHEHDPIPLTYEQAISEAKSFLDDFKHLKHKTVINVFEYKDGYQVDIITEDPSYEIYSDLYWGDDVVAQIVLIGEEKVVNKMK